jgi:hypothetical protein
VYGYSQIDLARNAIATAALRDGFDETFWIDSDIEFAPEDVFKIRQHNLPICCGIYPKKGRRELACHVMPGASDIHFGPAKGGLTEILYAGAGFLHVRRSVYSTIERILELPTCNAQFGAPSVPYFQPAIKSTPAGQWYLGEDYAFCERARHCGYKILADTCVRLRHIGKYAYSWEDVGSDLARYPSYQVKLN